MSRFSVLKTFLILACTAACAKPVVVEPVHVTSVSLDRNDLEMLVNQTVQLTASVFPSDADDKRIIWSSGDARIASVEEGTVTAHRDGKTFIYATSNDGGYRASCAVQVTTPGYIKGKWYLGYYVSGGVIHFDGTEYLDFDGIHLGWLNKGDGNSYYDIVYAEDNSSFVAKDRTSGRSETFTIVTYTDQLLVLASGGAKRYFYPSASAARDAEVPVVDPARDELSDVESILKLATAKTYSSQTPMGKHYENRKEASEQELAWLSDPANEPSGIGTYNHWVRKTVTLYPYGDPIPADCNQRSIGDCSALAVFASWAYLYPDFIKSVLQDNGDGTYRIGMYDPKGRKVTVGISDAVLCGNDGAVVQCTGKGAKVTWATLLEKAMAKYEDVYKVDDVNGIGSEFVAPLFTGNGSSFAFMPNTLYPQEMKKVVEWLLLQGKIVIGGFNVAGLDCDGLKTVTGHAFTYMFTAKPGRFLFSMRNPWGNGATQDGVLNIPDDKRVVYTIDMRVIEPGAAAPFLRTEIGPYLPPAYAVEPDGKADR